MTLSLKFTFRLGDFGLLFASGCGMGYPWHVTCWSCQAIYNMENLTANHNDASCWERCHVSRTLKNPVVVFDGSRNLCALPQEAKLPDPTHPSFLSCDNQHLSTLLSLCPIPFFISSSSFHVHFVIPFMFIA